MLIIKPNFLTSVIHQFCTPKNSNSFIISPDLFEDSKPFILIEIPYCEESENASKIFFKKIRGIYQSKLQNCNKMDNKKG